MKTLLRGVTLLAVIAMPAAAETPYDRNLEKAVMDIVAGKIGEIRGGFSYGQMPQLVVPPEATPVLPVATGHPRKKASGKDGLVPAVERRASRTIF
ncbi:hypothetical protein [Mesorhizobium sp.]|uniref:hypothetical protein n=1 Tax=Mesorhizobium sp. TaxID=1871066 RepID=UPI00120699F5|nr:hypothetical protein [Mesorhizobium sp.]TIO31211.1 MAG: hypothetical protein E5X89_24545 [Mesorhizobium sp.]